MKKYMMLIGLVTLCSLKAMHNTETSEIIEDLDPHKRMTVGISVVDTLRSHYQDFEKNVSSSAKNTAAYQNTKKDVEKYIEQAQNLQKTAADMNVRIPDETKQDIITNFNSVLRYTQKNQARKPVGTIQESKD